MALEAVDSVKLVFFVREAAEPDGGLCRAAALARLSDGVADAAVGQPAGVTAVVPQQFPGSVHLPHLGDLGAVFLAGPDCLVVG